ncbi:MAG: ribonuclease PH [SAR324 cluster bacterium]|nr:ribonuclease PH [SAR324 cluster bacterium]
MTVRTDNRKDHEPRPIKITTDFTMHPAGSVLVETGNTKVICTASIEDSVPRFMKGTHSGWLTCEYGMLPGSTSPRKNRDISQGKLDGRSQEIQRLIGRSLRSVVDLPLLGDRTIWIDCDVIQADGGTRTASITGGFVAMILALRKLYEAGKIRRFPVNQFLAAISVGIVGGRPMLDLKYDEDSQADVDMNVVMLKNGKLIEVQGTAERAPFTPEQFNIMLNYAMDGLKAHFSAQKSALGGQLFTPRNESSQESK